MQTAYARMAYERQLRRQVVRQVPVKKSAATTIKVFLKEAARRTIAFLFTQVGVCGLVVAYNIMGAFAFRVMEGPSMGDPSPEQEASNYTNHMVSHLWNITLRLNVLEEDLWRAEVKQALREYQDNMIVPLVKTRGYRGLSLNESWSFSGALMYSLSIYTTIGYGNITPRTVLGKVCTILYAVMGMPLFLLYMTNVGEVLANVFKFIYFKACRCGIGSLGYYRSASGTIRPVTSSMNELNGVESTQKTVPIIWCLLVIATYVIFGGLVFSRWEKWTLLDGCYFCYVSLTTIGMGDLVPEGTVGGYHANDSELGTATNITTSGYLKTLSEVESQQVVCTVYLLVGMALLAMCFSLMQEEAIENLKAFWRNLGCMRKKSQRNEEDAQELNNTPGG